MNMAIAEIESILDEKVHGRLIADLDRVASVANIPKTMIHRTMKDYCTPEEIDWVRHIRNRGGDKVSLAYVGDSGDTPIESRMMAMTGACLRNFIDARLMTLQEVINLLKEDAMPEPTVLMIPNFFIGKDDGGQIASWEVSSLLGLLISRLSAGKVTVLYVQSLKQLEAQYGKPFTTHIKQYFTLIA